MTTDLDVIMSATISGRTLGLLAPQPAWGQKGVAEVASSITGEFFHAGPQVVADNFTIETMWAVGQGGLDKYAWGFFRSDKDIWVELQNDDGAGADTIMMFVPAGPWAQIPGRYGGDVFNVGAEVEDTDWGDVDQIRVKRDVADAIGDAIVEMVLVV